MIKTEKGTLNVKGHTGVIYADLAIIARGIFKATSEEMDQEQAENFILDAISDGIEEAKREMDEKPSVKVKEMSWPDFLETLAKILKEEGDE